jgi:hypothetical protein
MSKYNDEQYRQAAGDDLAKSDIEVDADAIVSKGDDDGAWVQAWVWVHDSTIVEQQP